jgi:riboflavin transporter FmnP
MQTQQKPRTKKDLFPLTLCGVMSAMAIVMALLIHFPIFRAVSFLEYDAGDIPIFLLSMMIGPVWGSGASIVTAIIQGTTVSASAGIIGIIMNVLSTCSFIWLYALSAFLLEKVKWNRTLKAALATFCGIFGLVFAMTLWNLLVTPFYMGVPRSKVISYLHFFVLFNVIKGAINGVCAFLLHRVLARAIGNRKK